MKPIIIAVDFDGTCVKHAHPNVGEDIGAQPVLRDLVAAGHKLILWTMRSGKELQDAVAWFTFRGIPLYGIQRNPQQYRWTSSPKAYAHLYIDDAALGCPLVPLKYEDPVYARPYADWELIRRLLVRQGVLPWVAPEPAPPKKPSKNQQRMANAPQHVKDYLNKLTAGTTAKGQIIPVAYDAHAGLLQCVYPGQTSWSGVGQTSYHQTRHYLLNVVRDEWIAKAGAIRWESKLVMRDMVEGRLPAAIEKGWRILMPNAQIY